VTAKLPCGPLTGTVDGAGSQQYTLTISYFTADPVAAQKAGSPLTPMKCAPGFGTYEKSTDTYTPSFVQLVSTGTDGAAVNGVTSGRTLQTSYVVETTNTNISGGLIRIYPDATSGPMCMDAGSATPPTTTPYASLHLQPCTSSDAPSAQQVWSYNSDLSIQLVSSKTKANPNGLCVDAATPHAVGNPMILTPCAAPGAAPYNQQWSINDNSDFNGAKADKSNLDSFCIYVASQTANAPLTLATCAGGVSDTTMTWLPSPNVGAGMAGSLNNQVVNYYDFGRCIDVTKFNVNTTFLITYPCKQNPSPSQVGWNQKFTFYNNNGAWPYGQWITSPSKTTGQAGNYCLRSPLATGTGKYVTVTPCTVGVPAADQQWINSGTRDAQGKELPYFDKFTQKDNKGFCLAEGDPPDHSNPPDLWLYNTVVVAPCNGSTTQKWNADPNLQVPSLQNIRER
jgi:hypothetical protein